MNKEGEVFKKILEYYNENKSLLTSNRPSERSQKYSVYLSILESLQSCPEGKAQEIYAAIKTRGALDSVGEPIPELDVLLQAKKTTTPAILTKTAEPALLVTAQPIQQTTAPAISIPQMDVQTALNYIFKVLRQDKNIMTMYANHNMAYYSVIKNDNKFFSDTKLLALEEKSSHEMLANAVIRRLEQKLIPANEKLKLAYTNLLKTHGQVEIFQLLDALLQQLTRENVETKSNKR